jgi:hypothetical protein
MCFGSEAGVNGRTADGGVATGNGNAGYKGEWKL